MSETKDANVDKLTVPGTMPTLIADLTCAANGSYTENYVRALCERAAEALQSLSQEAVRDEVLEEAFTVHHDFDLERITLAMVRAVDDEYARNEKLRIAYAHDAEYRLRTIAAVHQRFLNGWIDLVIKPLLAKYHRHFQSMQRIVEREALKREPNAGLASDSRENGLKALVYRAYNMMQMAGYRIAEQDSDHNNPIIAWMADARIAMHTSAPEKTVFKFNRYRDGVLMAEGIRVHASDFAEATNKAEALMDAGDEIRPSSPAAPEPETPIVEEYERRLDRWYPSGFDRETNEWLSWPALARSLERRLSLAQTEIKGHMRVEDDLRRDLERGFMEGAYARLKVLQAAEYELEGAKASIAELEKDWETDADYVRMAERIKELEKLLQGWDGYCWKDGEYIDDVQEFFDAALKDRA